MSVNIRESGSLVNVERKIPKTFAQFDTNEFTLDPSNKKLSLNSSITAKLSSIDSNGKVSADNIKSGTSAKSNAELTETLSTYSNPNLIDNPFFAINSKGQSSYSGGTTRVYTFDKWFFNPNNTISITKNSNGSFTLQNLSSAVYGICQEFTNKLDKGKEYTFTIDTNDYSNISSIAFYNNTSSWTLQTTVNPTPKATFTNTFDIGLMAIYIKANSSITFNSVKLELGGKSTLSNDISFNEGFTPSTISNELSVIQNQNLVLLGTSNTPEVAVSISQSISNFREVLMVYEMARDDGYSARVIDRIPVNLILMQNTGASYNCGGTSINCMMGYVIFLKNQPAYWWCDIENASTYTFSNRNVKIYGIK